MDPNLMSCPTCGHSVSNISGTCTYCGAMVLDANQQPQPEEKEVGEIAQVTDSPPPLPQEDTVSAGFNSAEADKTTSAAEAQSDPDRSQQPANLQPAAETSASATEAVDGSVDESEFAEPAVESQPPEDEKISESKSESGQIPPDVERVAEISLIEPVEAESEPDDDTELIAEKMNDTPEPEVVDLAGNEPDESETLGEDIVELIEIDATRHESETQSAAVTLPPPDKSGEAAKTYPVQELPAENNADIVIDAEAELTSKSLGDTILLEADDEVKPAAGNLPDKIEETAGSESTDDALKIEKAAQEMSEAIEKQKAALAEAQKIKMQKQVLTKAQALKKQKDAQVKVIALKKQKMILAKAAALKRKKAALAKAKAGPKQQDAQTPVETAKKVDSAAANTVPAAGKPKIDRSLETNSTMKSLLEKYKGQAIGINYDNSAEIREAQLVEANSEYFSVFVKDKKLHYSYPLKSVLTVIEGQDGVDAGDPEKKGKFNVVIKVYPLVLF